MAGLIVLNSALVESPAVEEVLLIVEVNCWMTEVDTQILKLMNLTEVENLHLLAVAVLVVVIRRCCYLGTLIFENEIEVRQQRTLIVFVVVVKNSMSNQTVDFELNSAAGCLG